MRMDGPDGRVTVLLPWSDVFEGKEGPRQTAAEAMIVPMEVAYPDEVLRGVAARMAHGGLGVLPVFDGRRARRV